MQTSIIYPVQKFSGIIIFIPLKLTDMKTIFFVFILGLSSMALSAQQMWQGPSVDFSKGALMVSQDGRHLIHKNDDPFFYLGDTAWELFHRLSREDAEKYLENRRSKGFTVIQAVVLAELDGLNEANYYGEKPLIDNDVRRPNEKYFEHVDWIIKKAGEKGLYIGLLPTWGDKVDLATWGKGPEIFDVEKARIYGKWIAKRYKDFPNIIWINGGDRSGGDGNTETWNALGSAIKSVDKNHLMTFHPWGGRSSSEWFHNEEWLDFNMMQTGHGERYISNYERIGHDRSLAPEKPVLDGEPCYEDHAINWNPANGWFDDADVRCLSYWGIIGGACGTTYGAHPIWQFYSPGKEAITHARHYWYEVLDLPGSSQMMYLRKLMESRDWMTMEPAQGIILNDCQEGTLRIIAGKGKDFAMIYAPVTGFIRVDHSKLFGEDFRVSWFNPRTGESNEVNVKDMKDPSLFVPPVKGIDWVLLIDKKN